jgi:predicted Zn-dependent peptidase
MTTKWGSQVIKTFSTIVAKTHLSRYYYYHIMKMEKFGVDFNETSLTNGVKLYSFYKPNSPIYFRVYFYAGSQFDEGNPGLAHFCEHIMVSGTEKYPTKTILNEKIEH